MRNKEWLAIAGLSMATVVVIGILYKIVTSEFFYKLLIFKFKVGLIIAMFAAFGLFIYSMFFDRG